MLEKALFTLLSGFAGGRVYALRAPQNADAPFIIYQRTSGERWRSLGGPSGVAQAVMQVDVYAHGYYEARSLAQAVEAALDGYRGVVACGGSSPQDAVRIGACSLIDEVDMLDQTDEPLLYRVSHDYLFTYQY